MEPSRAANRHRARASAALEIGRYVRAEEEARASLAIEPRHIDGNLYLARALLGQARYADAAHVARDAVGLAPHDAYAHYVVGFALQASGRSSDSIPPLRESVRLNPRGARYYARLAIALLDTKDTTGARACIDTALEIDPDNAYLLDEAARVYGLLGLRRRAEELARKVLTAMPDSATSHWRLAWVLGLSSRFDEATDAARAALSIDPNHWPSWEELGYALFERRLDLDAETALRETLRLKPGLQSATANLAQILIRRGEFQRAEAVCDAAIVADPGNEKLRSVRDGVRSARRRRRNSRTSATVALGSVFAALVYALANAESFPEAVMLIVVVVLVALALFYVRRSSRADVPPSRLDR